MKKYGKYALILALLVGGLFLPVNVGMVDMKMIVIRDENGVPIKDIRVKSIYSYPSYDIKNVIRTDKTNSNGSALFMNVNVRVSVWQFIYKQFTWDCDDQCNCHMLRWNEKINPDDLRLYSSGEYWTNVTRNKTTDYYIVGKVITTDNDSIDWISLDKTAITLAAMELWKLGPDTSIPKSLWGELEKFHPRLIITQKTSVKIFRKDGYGYEIFLFNDTVDSRVIEGVVPSLNENSTNLPNVFRFQESG